MTGLTVTDDSMTEQTHTVVTINMDDVGMTAVGELASGVVLVIDRSSVDKDQRLLTSARLETAERTGRVRATKETTYFLRDHDYCSRHRRSTCLILCSRGGSQSLLTSQWLSRKVRTPALVASDPRTLDLIRPGEKILSLLWIQLLVLKH